MNPISDKALDVLFREARSYNAMAAQADCGRHASSTLRCAEVGPHERQWLSRPVHCSTFDEIERKAAAGSLAGEHRKRHDCPVTAIIAYDLKFYEKLPRLYPCNA